MFFFWNCPEANMEKIWRLQNLLSRLNGLHLHAEFIEGSALLDVFQSKWHRYQIWTIYDLAGWLIPFLNGNLLFFSWNTFFYTGVWHQRSCNPTLPPPPQGEQRKTVPKKLEAVQYWVYLLCCIFPASIFSDLFFSAPPFLCDPSQMPYRRVPQGNKSFSKFPPLQIIIGHPLK